MPPPGHVLHGSGAMLVEQWLLPLATLHLPPALPVIDLIVSPAGGTQSKRLMNLVRFVFST